MTEPKPTRLITFLGTGNYRSTRYVLAAGAGVATPYVANAIARLWAVNEVLVLATDAAQARHGAGLRAALAGHCEPQFLRIPAGRSGDELWEQFEVLRQSFDGYQDIILDITHGFRSQPFFAAGAVSYLRMAGDLKDRDVSVLYGRYLEDEPEESPIWDLTPFVDLLDWAQGAAVLAATGHAGPLVAVARNTDEAARRRLAREGRRDFPRAGRLISALEAFAADLDTVRVASLITGYAQDPAEKEKARGSAAGLIEALDAYEAEASGRLPALAPVLATARGAAAGLAAGTLTGSEGQQAMALLARRYLALGKYPAAAIVLREALVCAHGEAAAVEVNSTAFDSRARAVAEQAWRRADPDGQREIAAVRNDIEHGGFKQQPMAAAALKRRLEKLVGRLPAPVAESIGPQQGRTWLVTRHPGALEWMARQGIAVERQVEHLDSVEVQATDTVIGTLPVQLAAAVCARGARYLHLTIDLPASARGRELSADDLERYGARLECYRIEAIF